LILWGSCGAAGACAIARPAANGNHGGCRHAASQQPEEVPAAALDRIMYAAIAVVEFVVTQVGCQVDVSWQAPALQQRADTP
jgi:hypothetical protein